MGSGALALLVLLSGACGDNEDGATTGQGSDRQAQQGEELKIGFLNMEGGALSFAPRRVGAEAAVTYVNDKGGRRIRLIRCDTNGKPESSVDCANKFVEQRVAAVLQGLDFGADAALPILTAAGIPLVGHQSTGPKQDSDPNVYLLGNPNQATVLATLKHYQDQGAKTVNLFIVDVPSAHAFWDPQPALVSKALGMTLKVVYTNPSGADWNSLVASAVASKPDVIGFTAASEPDCIGLVRGLRVAGYKGHVLAATCSRFITELGDQAKGVHIRADRWRADAASSAPAEVQREIEAFHSAMKKANQELAASDPGAAIGFGDVVDLAHVLGTIEGAVDGPAIAKAFRGSKGYRAFLGPEVTCDRARYRGLNGCHAGGLVYEVQAGGKLGAVTREFVDVADALNR